VKIIVLIVFLVSGRQCYPISVTVTFDWSETNKRGNKE